ncbi:MAG: hypothetical protein H6814_05665 [Phycisphaeraceae bacterium]|nr:hypothetical protein [Phycisphaeraceae bacterium]
MKTIVKSASHPAVTAVLGAIVGAGFGAFASGLVSGTYSDQRDLARTLESDRAWIEFKKEALSAAGFMQRNYRGDNPDANRLTEEFYPRVVALYEALPPERRDRAKCALMAIGAMSPSGEFYENVSRANAITKQGDVEAVLGRTIDCLLSASD